MKTLFSFLTIFVITGVAIAGGEESNPGKNKNPLEGNISFPFNFLSSSGADTGSINIPGDTTRHTVKGQKIARKKIYRLNVENYLYPSSWRQTEEAFKQAMDYNADYVVINLNEHDANLETNTSEKIKSISNKTNKPVIVHCKNNKSIIINKNKTITALSSDVLLDNEEIISKHDLNCMANKDLRIIADPSVYKALNNKNTASTYEVIEYKVQRSDRFFDQLTLPFQSTVLLSLFFVFFFMFIQQLFQGFSLLVAISTMLLFCFACYFENLLTVAEIIVVSSGMLLTGIKNAFGKYSKLCYTAGLMILCTGLSLAITDNHFTYSNLDFLSGTLAPALLNITIAMAAGFTVAKLFQKTFRANFFNFSLRKI